MSSTHSTYSNQSGLKRPHRVPLVQMPRKKQKRITKPTIRKMITSKINAQLEDKFYTNNGSNSIPATAGFITPLTSVSQGDSDTTRNGDCLVMKKLYVRGYFTVSGSMTNAQCPVRLFIVQWAPLTAATLTISQFMTILGTPNSTTSMTNWDSRPMFKILYDKWFNVDTYHSAVQFACEITDMHKKIQFQTGTNSGTNHIFIAAISESNTTIQEPVMNWNTRLVYNDA